MGTENVIVKKSSTGKIVIFFILVALFVGLGVWAAVLLKAFPASGTVGESADTSSEVIVVDPAKAMSDLNTDVESSIVEAEKTNVMENRAPSVQGKTDLTTQSVNLYVPSEKLNVCVYVNTGATCPESKPYIYAMRELLKDKETTVISTGEGVYVLQNPTKDVAVVASVNEGLVVNVAVINKASDYFRVSTGLYSQGQIANIEYNVGEDVKNKVVEYAKTVG